MLKFTVIIDKDDDDDIDDDFDECKFNGGNEVIVSFTAATKWFQQYRHKLCYQQHLELGPTISRASRNFKPIHRCLKVALLWRRRTISPIDLYFYLL